MLHWGWKKNVVVGKHSGLGAPQGNSEYTAESIKNIQWRGGGEK